MMGAVCPVYGLFGPAPVELISLWNFNHVLRFLFSFFLRYVAGMYQVSDRALSFPCPSHLIPSVRVIILKEYENLHVHFEDCAGRRVINASGAFPELAPCSGSSNDAVNIDKQFLVIVLFLLCSFPSPTILSSARRIAKYKRINVQLVASRLSSLFLHTIAKTLLQKQVTDRLRFRPSVKPLVWIYSIFPTSNIHQIYEMFVQDFYSNYWNNHRLKVRSYRR